MRFVFFALLFVVNLSLFAQQDSVPPPKKIDSLPTSQDSIPKVQKLDSLTVKLDSVSLAKKSDSIPAKLDSIAKMKELDSVTVARDSVRKPKKLDSLAKKKPTKKKPMLNRPRIPELVEDTVRIDDYKIISYARDTTILDTTLTIRKEYKYNYLRKDDFEVMPFENIGRPYNVLGRTFSKNSYYPLIGATARHANYFEVEDINYYHVPTPMTELMFKTTLEQGQLLDALLAFNLSKQFSASIAYKGFRSLGKYRFDQTQSGNFRTTFNYVNKKNNYAIRGHITAQDLESEENGGLLLREQFESTATDDFSDRSRIDVVYTNANNRILGKRYYFDHQWKLFNVKKDSTKGLPTSLTLGHEFTYETKFYDFTQSSQNSAFGSDPFVTPIEDRAR
ncbi:MAG: putative porin, partial [Allomuricauda sp.]